MSYQYTNNASTTLATGITSGSTTITLSTGTGALFPILTGGNVFRGTLVDAATQTLREIVQVTGTSGDTFNITRAQEGTSARAYNAGDIFYLDVTAAQYTDFFSKTYDSFPNQPGRLINFQIITSTGTYTPTTGTNSIIFYLVGGGGGGGGCAATAMNAAAAGAGGGGGALVVSRVTSGFSGQPITIGAGGAGGVAGANGSAGGNSTFLSATASGGAGGVAGTSATTGQVTPGTNNSGASGGNLNNQGGRPGKSGIILTSNNGIGGAGAGSYFTPDTPDNAKLFGAGDGFIAQGVGGGGSGGVNANGSFGALPARSGGNGQNGVCLIYEYA